MTSNSEKPINQLRLFATAPHPCSYLEEEASTVFIDPDVEIDIETFAYLNARGFRRSGQHIYKPSCLDCQACLSYRVITSGFKTQAEVKEEFSIKTKMLEYLSQPIY